MLPEFKIHKPILFGIFLTFATIKVVGEPKQQNLISAKKFVKGTGCLQSSNSLVMMLTFAGQIFQFVARPGNVDNYGFNFTLRHPLNLWKELD